MIFLLFRIFLLRAKPAPAPRLARPPLDRHRGLVRRVLLGTLIIGLFPTATWAVQGDASSRTGPQAHEFRNPARAQVPVDDNGNLTDDGSRLLVWDAFNRLVLVARKADAAPIAAYFYLPDGRRSRKVVYSQTTPGVVEREVRFVWDGAQEVEEQSAAGVTLATFVWSPVYVDELVEFRREAAHPLGAGSFYAHQDARCDVVAVTNASGQVVEKRRYDDFGREEIRDAGGAVVAASPSGLEYGFQGRRRDQETGWLYFRARFYDPGTGRFLSRDPVWDAGNVGGWYTFVGNGPVSGRDPSGLQYWGWPQPDSNKLTPGQRDALKRAGDAAQAEQQRLRGQGGLDMGAWQSPGPPPKPLSPEEVRARTSGTADWVPVVNDAKGFIEATTGYDPVTRKPIGGWGQAAAAAGLVVGNRKTWEAAGAFARWLFGKFRHTPCPPKGGGPDAPTTAPEAGSDFVYRGDTRPKETIQGEGFQFNPDHDPRASLEDHVLNDKRGPFISTSREPEGALGFGSPDGDPGVAYVYKIKPDPNDAVDVQRVVPGASPAEAELAFPRPIRPEEVVEQQTWRWSKSAQKYELGASTPMGP